MRPALGNRILVATLSTVLSALHPLGCVTPPPPPPVPQPTPIPAALPAPPDGMHGWYGEALHEGLRTSPTRPLYIFSMPVPTTHTALEIEMVYVPPGNFLMGSNIPQSPQDERPQHLHPMPGYYVARNDVTWAQYSAYCELAGHRTPPAPSFGMHDDHPVVNVTWQDAADFCAWAGLRLPSEPEWEKAARGPDGRKYPWGKDDPAKSRCVCQIPPAYGDRGTAPVGSRPAGASPYGALDMAGNAWQWCADHFDEDAYRRHANGDMTPPAAGTLRIRRGGGWDNFAQDMRATVRSVCGPADRYEDLGFRPALDGSK